MTNTRAYVFDEATHNSLEEMRLELNCPSIEVLLQKAVLCLQFALSKADAEGGVLIGDTILELKK